MLQPRRNALADLLWRRLMQHRYYINVFWYPDDECWIETAKDRGLPIPKPRYRPAIYAAA